MSESLEKLRVLTESLTLRDKKRIQELSLYQSFFNEVPVRTYVWSVGPDMDVRIKNKKSLKGKCGNTVLKNGTLKDAFSCSKMNEINIRHHKEALAGNKQTYLSYEGDVTFLTTLIPVAENSETVVYGCSWDVTNIVKISAAIEAVSSKAPELCKDVKELINSSPMFKLVKELE